MGEMPKLGPDPWSLMQAFGREYARQRGPNAYQAARLDQAQDERQDKDDYLGQAGDNSDTPTPSPAPVAAANPPANLKPLVSDAANAAGVSPPLFARLVQAESNFNPNAVSPTGARGLTQLMPGTAKVLGVNPNDPAQNLAGGARYLAQQEAKFGDDGRALAAYNWGPGNVQKWIDHGADPSKAPLETQNYVKKITGKPLADNDAPPPDQDSKDQNPDFTDPTTRLAWLG